MRELIRKLHNYAGLLCFTLLLIYGAAGLTATIRKGAEGSAPGFGPPHFESFALPPGAGKQQAADMVYDHLTPPLCERLPADLVETDHDGNLRLDFWSVNGVERVTVLAGEGRLKIQEQRSDFADFLNALHATLTGYPSSFALLRIWGVYNHFGLLCMLFLALTGVYLWLISRPRYRPAQVLLFAGAALFALIYAVLR